MPAKKDTETAVAGKTAKKAPQKAVKKTASATAKSAGVKSTKKKTVRKATEATAAGKTALTADVKVEKQTVKTAVATTTKKAASAGTRLTVRQVRSGIGSAYGMKRTLVALGLRHHQDVVSLPDNASVRGMLNKVRHLVRVETVEK